MHGQTVHKMANKYLKIDSAVKIAAFVISMRTGIQIPTTIFHKEPSVDTHVSLTLALCWWRQEDGLGLSKTICLSLEKCLQVTGQVLLDWVCHSVSCLPGGFNFHC